MTGVDSFVKASGSQHVVASCSCAGCDNRPSRRSGPEPPDDDDLLHFVWGVFETLVFMTGASCPGHDFSCSRIMYISVMHFMYDRVRGPFAAPCVSLHCRMPEHLGSRAADACVPADAEPAAAGARGGVRVALLRRDTHQMNLTEAGQRMLVDAKTIIGHAEEADRRLREDHTMPQRILRLFAQRTWGGSWFRE